MPLRKFSVNLIPREELRKRSLEKFLSWVLNYGRFIIIGTEVIVLAAFLFRFKFDYELKGLSDEIKRKKAIIESYSDLEKNTRALQAHLNTIKSLEKQSLLPTKIITSLSSITPYDVTYSQFRVGADKISVSATAYSLEGFTSFLESMKRSKEYKKVTLDKLAEGRFGLEFTITFLYQGK